MTGIIYNLFHLETCRKYQIVFVMLSLHDKLFISQQQKDETVQRNDNIIDKVKTRISK
jgi:hypothetical protein